MLGQKNKFNQIKEKIIRQKILILSFLFLFAYSGALYVFATPPTTPYAPGATLDPTCAPGDTNCTVGILESRDEGTSLTYQTNALNFVGSGVTATESSGVVTVTISSGVSADSLDFIDMEDTLD